MSVVIVLGDVFGEARSTGHHFLYSNKNVKNELFTFTQAILRPCLENEDFTALFNIIYVLLNTLQWRLI